jgi:site-specific recombinase XerC
VTARKVVTCSTCGTVGPGITGMCPTCYARSVHQPRVCGGCEEFRRILAAGLCNGCYRRSRTRVRRCAACGETRNIHFADRCERCKQQARAVTGVCPGCGRQVARLYDGSCRMCRTRRSEGLGGCGDCLCWTDQLLAGRCRACRQFQRRNPSGMCRSCRRRVPLGTGGHCRLCLICRRVSGARCDSCLEWAPLIGVDRCAGCAQFDSMHSVDQCGGCDRTAALGQLDHCRRCQIAGGLRAPGGVADDVPPLQLFFGGIPGVRRRPTRLPQDQLSGSGPCAQCAGQLGLFSMPAQLSRVGAAGLDSPVGVEFAAIMRAARTFGEARGWTPLTLARVHKGLRVLWFSRRDGDGRRPFDQAEVMALPDAGIPALRTFEFLVDQGLVVAAPQRLDRWCDERLAVLPAPLAGEVRQWLDGLLGRSGRRRRQRGPHVVEAYLRAVLPALVNWAPLHPSLREITEAEVATEIAASTNSGRRLTASAMHSLFRSLKSERLIFTDPSAGLAGGLAIVRPALSLDDDWCASVLGRLDRPDQRLIVLLAGVHALRCSEITRLRLDNVDAAVATFCAGRRQRRLDQVTVTELRAWLRLRRLRWPTTANPYLLINQSTAGGIAPVGRSYVQSVCAQVGTTAQALRIDRLVTEAEANGADPVALARLYQLSLPTAVRYCNQIDRTDHGDADGQISGG